ncbi:VWA domain-containing protein [Aquimarina sp. AD1]|uniref:VWA domain-containing protein n=1 Tax=Aquimarina sp. (strain AD1) TaxID=1714848 RepID=UPI000E4EFE00|nr:VWA domain-containing protein [Aquimarina sp. AD1]AXT55476.1 VWA domain-containing protein [Aquimarina sp. AD1]RKN35983.1 VWA domain-containing protein [Aquimarina sp. AD1]
MQIQNIGLIIAAGVIAIVIALFQYMYKAKNRNKKNLFFAFLRFLSIFALLILLINPTFRKNTYYIEKPTLVFAVDNSSSIKHLKQDEQVSQFIGRIKDNPELKERFDVKYYSFSDVLKDSLGLTFDEKQTNISEALESLDQIYKNTNAPTVLITDGNQTYGRDYQFSSVNYKQQVYPIVIGDTTVVTDTKIQQLNVNKYAYLKNKFPVEVILTYSGTGNINTSFEIRSGKNIVYSKPVSFSEENNSTVINFTLPASSAGVLKYSARLAPIENEKNVINNKKDFAVEVIDQKTNVLLISDLTHPDLGAIKKSIESNERRSLTISRPSEVKDIEEYQLIILYQPNARFRAVYEKIKTARKNYFTITGSKTDWVFLNKSQNVYRQEITRQTEYYLPRFNPNYGTFLLEDIGFNDYPPLIGTFGEIHMKSSYDVLLQRNIGNIKTGEPLLATIEDNGVREAILFGEGIWRWRAQSYLDNKSFESFDDFFGRLVQYLASNKQKSRLNTISESFYYGNSSIKVKAEYFTKNYEFDRRGNLNIVVKNKDTEASQTIPMLLKNSSYEADLSSFASGNYEYTVVVVGENISRSGSFSILDYDVEQQLLNADVTKLRQVATNTKGTAYFMNQIDGLVSDLIEDQRYQAIQKSKENIVSLIDWTYLLMIIILLLSIEWFMRKYNGLI